MLNGEWCCPISPGSVASINRSCSGFARCGSHQGTMGTRTRGRPPPPRPCRSNSTTYIHACIRLGPHWVSPSRETLVSKVFLLAMNLVAKLLVPKWILRLVTVLLRGRPPPPCSHTAFGVPPALLAHWLLLHLQGRSTDSLMFPLEPS
jgi:hypothetical protein